MNIAGCELPRKAAAILVLAAMFMLSLTVAAAADEAQPGADTIKVVVNSKTLNLEVAPTVRCDRVMVPARAIAEELGARVIWQANKQSILIQKDEKTIIMTMYHPLAYVNDELVVLDVPPFSIDGSTLIPLYFVSQNMDAKASWNAESNTVTITSLPKAAAAYCLQ